MKKNPAHALVLLRFGLAFVFIWFACSQIGNPTRWVSFLPDFMKSMSIPATNFILMNASLELLGAVLLMLGIWTRLVGLLLSIHLFGIALSIGMTPVGVRDIGLAVASLALALGGAGTFSLDTHTKSQA